MTRLWDRVLHQPVCWWYRTGAGADPPLECAAIHRHLELGEGADRNLRELSRGGTPAGSSLHRGRNAAREGIGCSGEQKVDCEPAMCLCSKGGQLHVGLWKGQSYQQVKGVDSSPPATLVRPHLVCGVLYKKIDLLE